MLRNRTNIHKRMGMARLIWRNSDNCSTRSESDKKEVFSKSISAVGCGLFLFISSTQVCAQHISLVHDLVIAEGLDVCENRTPTVIYCNWPHSTFCSKVSDDYDQCAFAILSSTCIFNVIINGTI